MTTSEPNNTITVALVGNTNCGKSSLFNKLTGSHQHVANFSGTTVAKKTGSVTHNGRTIDFVDLPGIASLSSGSMREVVSRRFILEEQPDVIVNVLDTGNLERSLLLSTQLIETGLRRVHCLNMVDEAGNRGISVKSALFSTLLNAPVVETVGHKGEGVDALLDAVLQAADAPEPESDTLIHYDNHLEESIQRLHEELPHDAEGDALNHHQARWLAIKLLEGDEEIAQQQVKNPAILERARLEREKLAAKHSNEASIMLANGRFGFIRGLTHQTVERKQSTADEFNDRSSQADSLFLNRVFGLPIFFFLMWLMFQTTFELGAYPMDWIDAAVGAFGEWVGNTMSDGQLKSLIVEGIIGGVGGVLVFLPNIVILFLFIALFEDTGYMARVPFLVDRFMRALGLQGKAFIPMLMGFGCNVPAIMATRTIENPKERILTIIINPFMSCAARLPVYILLAGAFFADSAGTVVFGMYLGGIVVALASAFLLKRTLFQAPSEPFVMELPPYRRPTINSVISHMIEPVMEFLKKVGGVVLVGSIIIWFLQAYPVNVPLSKDYEGAIARVEANIVQAGDDKAAIEALEESKTKLEVAMSAEQQENRYLGRLGKTIAPLFEPMGMDWKSSVAILTGLVAKEVVVSTLGVLYRVGEEVGEDSTQLMTALRNAMPASTALALMVFVLLYMPCISTVAVIWRETGSLGWTGFSVGFSMATAYIMAMMVNGIAVQMMATAPS
ncbi:MAG: ferrous iron transport protein B [Magnetococcales bacterium]|nr:ferrous iron transport protein B [Magnetococcales bacterium]